MLLLDGINTAADGFAYVNDAFDRAASSYREHRFR